MKRILAFVLALLLLLGISGLGYIRSDRARKAEEQRVNEINDSYERLLALIEEKSYEEAAAQAKACLELITAEEQPDMVADVTLKLACVEAVLGERDNALTHCLETLALQPDSAEAELLSSSLYSELGQPEESEDALRRYIEQSGDASYRFRLGLLALQREEFGSAVAELTLYIDDYLCAEDKDACDESVYFRGVSYLALEQYLEAAEDFERCARNRVEYEESLFNAALCRLLNNELVRALALFNRCQSEGIQAERSAEYIEMSMEMVEKESSDGEQ